MSTAKYHHGQRVKVRPGHCFPPTSLPGGIRYGTIGMVTNKAGMSLTAEGRLSEEGEWAYTVHFTPGGGASWWSEKMIIPVRGHEPALPRSKSEVNALPDTIRNVIQRLNDPEAYVDACDEAIDLLGAYSAALKDVERLNWVEAQSNGDLWVARQSVSGRGFRLHNTSPAGWPGTKRTARQAIDAAMNPKEP